MEDVGKLEEFEIEYNYFLYLKKKLQDFPESLENLFENKQFRISRTSDISI